MIHTWTFIRFLHVAAITFFVGGQIVLITVVAPVMRRDGDDRDMRAMARRFGTGSALALAVILATGAAMASHFDLWGNDTLQAKLGVVVLIGVLTGVHVVRPHTRALSYAIAVASLLVVWLGLKLTYG